MFINKQELKSKYMLIEGVVSVLVNIALFAGKYIIGISIGSLAIVADAWHTLSDCISSFIVIIGGIFSKMPPDKEHPFGHGRLELITGFIVGIMLIFVSYSFAFEAIKDFLNKKHVTFTLSSIIITVASIFIKEALAQYSLWAFRKSESKALYADAWHHRSDSLTSIIILAGILFGKNLWWIDSAMGLLVSIVIFYAGFDVIRNSVKPLIGEYPSEETIEDIRLIAKELGILNDNTLHHFHMHRYGEHMELTFHMRFPKNTTVYDAHEIVSCLENAIRERLGIESTIHIESEKEIVLQ